MIISKLNEIVTFQISQEELKKHFSLKGNITDVRLIYKNGEFRRYAFIGYEGEGDASATCDYFHNTFIKQAKVTVEICHDFSKWLVVNVSFPLQLTTDCCFITVISCNIMENNQIVHQMMHETLYFCISLNDTA